jgi:acyl-CoA thioesterase
MTFISTAVDKDRFAETVGVRLVEVSAGYAKAEMTIEDRHLNGLDMAHGGAIFTVADLAFAAACNSHGIDAVAVSVSVSFLKAAATGDRLTAEAREVSVSRKLGTYLMTVTNDRGETVASMQGVAFRKTPKK